MLTISEIRYNIFYIWLIFHYLLYHRFLAKGGRILREKGS